MENVRLNKKSAQKALSLLIRHQSLVKELVQPLKERYYPLRTSSSSFYPNFPTPLFSRPKVSIEHGQPSLNMWKSKLRYSSDLDPKDPLCMSKHIQIY